MDRQLEEEELNDEIGMFEATDSEDSTQDLQYHYDLYQTVVAFNEYLCIQMLNTVGDCNCGGPNFHQI